MAFLDRHPDHCWGGVLAKERSNDNAGPKRPPQSTTA